MKGNPELIDKLNYLLEGELTAINQYMVHAEMCEDWGYEKLSKNFKDRAITEMHHAEHLIERILFLEGKPIVSNLNEMHIGSSVQGQVDKLKQILMDEDRHVDELEDLQDELEQMGTQVFLSTQM